ncbi:MAG: glycosyltransferase family 2 protein, partial [Desulfobacteraceae bacterium]|nr:glycosyltransferase family 2 protein [Desulfobacteraceae bacterium]
MEIVTPVHNRKAFTLRCLKSLSEINKSGLDIHVIVVDDGSTDGTGDEIRRNYPDVQIVNGDGNLWYAGGTNRGIEAALKRNPDYILAINDDSEFHPEFLQRMIKCSQQNTRSVVGALLLLRDDPDKVFAVAPKWQTWYGGWRQFRHLTVDTVPQKPWQVETIAGNCVLYPKQVIQEVGLMDERHFLLYADVEYL